MQHLDEGRLQAWLDRPRSGLQPDELDAIAQHLDACESCATRVEALRASNGRARSLLGTRAAGGPPPFDAVRARAQKGGGTGASEGPRAAVRRWRWRSTSWAASVALALGAGWLANDLVRRPGAGSGEEVRMGAAAAETATGAVPARDADAATGSNEARAEAPPPAPQPVIPAPAPPSARIEIPPPPVEEAERARRVATMDAPRVPPVDEATGAAATSPLSGLVSADRAAAEVANSPVFVRGRVVDAASGRPLEAAQVLVPALRKGALTGADGSFALLLDDSVASGGEEVTLNVQLIGFAEAARPLVIPRADTMLEDMRLETTALRLQELVVTGVPAPTPTRRFPDAPVRVRAEGPVGWVATGRFEAEEQAGFALLSVPDLPIMSVETMSADGVVLLRVVQELEEGGRLILIQAPEPVTLVPELNGRAVGSTRVGDVWVMALAPMSGEEVEQLLRRLR